MLENQNSFYYSTVPYIQSRAGVHIMILVYPSRQCHRLIGVIDSDPVPYPQHCFLDLDPRLKYGFNWVSRFRIQVTKELTCVEELSGGTNSVFWNMDVRKKMPLMQTNVNNKSLVKKIVGLLDRKLEPDLTSFFRPETPH
jgi:hypothetical protein